HFCRRVLAGPVSIEVLNDLGACGLSHRPHEAFFTPADQRLPRLAALPHDAVYGKSIEELVREDDSSEPAGKGAAAEVDSDVFKAGEGMSHLPSSGAQLDHHEVIRVAHLSPQVSQPRRDQDAEDRLELFGGEEVACLAEGIVRTTIVPEFGVVKR